MYTHDEYVYGWAFYLLGVLVVMACGWILTAKLRWSVVRHLLRLGVGVTLVVPWYASPEVDYLAPAWLIAAFEGLFEKDGVFLRAGTPLLTALGVALILYIIIAIVRFTRNRPVSE